MILPNPSFAHLQRLSDDTGLLEHAHLLTPRRGHGYTTDDVARGLIAVCREPAPGPALIRLAETYLAFLEHARRPDGAFHNRLSYDRRWGDVIGSGDSHGRALWALGVAAASAPEPWLRESAAAAFRMSRPPTGEWFRPPAFALLGAAAVLSTDPLDEGAAAMAKECADRLPRPLEGSWPWPEPRLAYENARIPEGLLAAGVALDDPTAVADGLELLEWLVQTEMRGGHFSFAPVGGWAPGEPRPGFDQQPVEAAAVADACARAWEITADPVWADRVLLAAGWLMGDNDSGTPLYDAIQGTCSDGLTPDGVSANAGAESTLSAISVLQQARRVDTHTMAGSEARKGWMS